MAWKFTANAGFFGRRRDRFTEYQPDRSLEEKLALVAQVEGVAGVELKYPTDLQDVARAKALLSDCGLQLSAVNVDIKDAAHFRYGALSARDGEARRKAVALLTEGMDIAAAFGIDLVTTCPLADGYDYPFQIDFADAWGRFIDTVRTVVQHRADVTLLLEYQPNEPHARIMLGDVGKVLHVCAEVDAPNLGANFDVGHAFAAGDTPAEAAALLASKGRLKYIHTNDNTGDGGDWDMISGSVHFWHWMELLHTLKKIGYTGWFGGDIAPKHMGPVDAYRTNVLMIERMTAALDRIGWDEIQRMVERDGAMAETYDLLTSMLT